MPQSPPQGKPPAKTGGLKQPNNLLKVLTANVQSQIEKVITLILVENFDVIALNETWGRIIKLL